MQFVNKVNSSYTQITTMECTLHKKMGNKWCSKILVCNKLEILVVAIMEEISHKMMILWIRALDTNLILILVAILVTLVYQALAARHYFNKVAIQSSVKINTLDNQDTLVRFVKFKETSWGKEKVEAVAQLSLIMVWSKKKQGSTSHWMHQLTVSTAQSEIKSQVVSSLSGEIIWQPWE